MNEPIGFAKQLSDYLKGSLPEEERRQVEEVLARNAHLRQLAESLQNPSFVSHEVKRLQAFDAESALRQVLLQAPFRRQHRLRTWLAAAAAAVLLATGSFVWYRQYTAVTPPTITTDVQQAMARSADCGRQEASVEQFTVTKESLTQFVHKQVKKKKSSTTAPAAEAKADVAAEELLAARRVSTRSDREFWLTLPDGSLVHLNYNTSILYPEHFSGDTRDVVLDGEAYFMVAKDRRHPFFVHTLQGIVRVYGTSFNVSTHESDGQTSVVLVSGQVGISVPDGSELRLQPGQKCDVKADDWQVNNVDIAPYVAWNTGQFAFHEWPLERIMEVLARWYGYQVEYADDTLRQLKLSGNFSRYDDLAPTLEAIETVAGISIVQKPNQIIHIQ